MQNLPESDADVNLFAGWATSLMLIGWATGGIIFGICGDKFGRIKTLVSTIAMYALFTGLSGIAGTLWQFLVFRFLTGLGVGGAFSSCATLVAETMPERARPHALGFLQAIAAIGNISAAFITLGIGELVQKQLLPFGWATWRWSFLIGLLPMVLVPLIARYLHEPEAWQRVHREAKAGGKKAGSLLELFGDPGLRYLALMGMALATVGVIGFWGIMNFAIDMNRLMGRKDVEKRLVAEGTELDRQVLAAAVLPEFRKNVVAARVQADWFLGSTAAVGKDSVFGPQQVFAAMATCDKEEKPVDSATIAAVIGKETAASKDASGLEAAVAAYLEGGQTPPGDPSKLLKELENRRALIGKEVGWWGVLTSILINLGGFFGVYSFTWVTSRIGRRETFTIFLTAAMLSTLAVFLLADQIWKIYIFVPMMGFSLLSLMGGYTIYLPELFPTRLRSTTISFCYNVGRYVAAIGPAVFGFLTAYYKAAGFAEPIRYAGASLCPIFLVGILVIWCLPETRGKKLPE